MEYEEVVCDEPPPEEENRSAMRQRRVVYTCFATFLVTKLLVVCWILTMSIPLDPIASLLRGEWWGRDGD